MAATSTASSMDYAMNTTTTPTATYRGSVKGKRVIGTRGRGGRKLTPKQKNEVRMMINRRAELKYFPFTQVLTNVTVTPNLFGTAFDIPQGSSDVTRVGDSLMWCGTLEMNVQVVAGQTEAFNNTRLIIFQWHDTSQATPFPVASQILQTGPSGTQDIYSVYGHDLRAHFTILYDNVFTTVGTGAAATNPVTSAVSAGVHRIRVNLNKMASKRVQYVAGGAQGSNRLFLLTLSDSPVLSATHPQLGFMSKVFFRDS